MIELDDAGWTALASMVASIAALVAILVGNRRGSVIEQKTEAVQKSVTTPSSDSRTMAEIVSEAHPED